MLLTEVVLHNVGVFLGRHAVDLSVASKEKPVVLFGGLNGGGKTTFLESLQLGLYGKLAKTARRGNKAYEAYLESLINENVSPGEGACIEIAFREMEDQKERDYRVVRTWGRVRSRISESVEVYVDGLLDQQLSDSWDEAVERFLPQKLCNLFLFDGEQIEALADPNQSREILETAISGLLGVELVDQLVTDLQVTKRNKLRDRTDASYQQKFDQLSEDIESLRLRRDQWAAQREQLVHEAAEAQNALDRANADYERQGGHLLDRMKELEREKSEHKATQSRVREELRALAASALPLRMLGGQLETLEMQAEREQAARIFTDARPLLDEQQENIIAWLEQKVEEDELLPELRSFLSERRKEKEEEVAGEIELDLPRTVLHQLEVLRTEELDRLAARTGEAQKELESVEGPLAEIERLLVRVPEESALSDVISRRERARLENDRLNTELEAVDRELAEIDQSIEARQQEFEEVERQAKLAGLKDQLEERVIDTADVMVSTMESFKRKVLDRHLARLEALIFESYKSLLRKEGLVGGIRISPDTLELSVVGNDGRTMEPGRLSAGERQLLATSILWGLAKASGRALPVVIDTPLGRLDASHRTNLVENYFPNASHQVILLSTDEEIDTRYYRALAPSLGSEYEIYFDEERGGSAIRTGYPFEEAA